GVGDDRRHPSTLDAARGLDDPGPDQLVYPQRVRIVDRLTPERPPRQPLGGSTVAYTIEQHQPAVLVRPRGGDDQLVAVSPEAAPSNESHVGVVGRQLDHDLAAQPVRLGDAADLEQAVVGTRSRAGAQSTKSTSTSTPSRVAAARTTVRMLCAVRPRRPM